MITATVDDRKRVRLPNAKPGQVYAVEDDGGRVVLTPVTRQESRTVTLKWARDKRTFVMPDGKPVSLPAEGPDAILEAVAEARER